MITQGKTFFAILAMVIAVIIIVLLLKFASSKEEVPIEEVPEEEITGVSSCFIWNTEAGDHADLVMTVKDQNVEGEFNWMPWGKDTKTGTFSGTISELDEVTMTRTINAFWNASAEGMTTKEGLRILVSQNIASPGFGEMRDRGDGVYVYADPTLISYEPNLSLVPCEEITKEATTSHTTSVSTGE